MTDAIYPPKSNPAAGTTFLAVVEMAMGFSVMRFWTDTTRNHATTVEIVKNKRAGNKAAKLIAAATGEGIQS